MKFVNVKEDTYELLKKISSESGRGVPQIIDDALCALFVIFAFDGMEGRDAE